VFWIRIGSGFNQVLGSGFRIQIRIQNPDTDLDSESGSGSRSRGKKVRKEQILIFLKKFKNSKFHLHCTKNQGKNRPGQNFFFE